MITISKFTKREPLNLPIQGYGVFEYDKIRIVNTQGREMTTLSIPEAIQLRDALNNFFKPPSTLEW